MTAPIAQGRIVWVTVVDSRGGNPKRRPAVVVSATVEHRPGGAALVAAVTTDIGRAPFGETVELPSRPDGHPVTKLTKPSEVVCSWVARVAVADLVDTGGFLPDDVLAEVLLKVERTN